MTLATRLAGIGVPETAVTLLALVLSAVLMALIVLLARAVRGNRDLAAKMDDSIRLSEQAVAAVQLVGSQLNERIEAQSRAVNDQLAAQARATGEQQAAQARAQNEQLAQNREEMSREFTQVRQTMEERLAALAQDNATKLEAMRATVDEKLSETLQQRFSESFTLISERLESVQQGLGEMRTLAGNVTDLRNVLANVKNRGNFGEYQLKALLEDVFTPDQYEANFAPNLRSQQRVEFAVRLPGYDEPVYMPIDSKFPIDDYQRLLEASENGDNDGVAACHKVLVNKAKGFARDIRDRYLNPPRTTDFGVMFVPTEGIYAELMREPGFADELRHLKVLIAGPSTMQALIVSYQIGFSTLAISKRSSEIERLLGAVKTDFGKFQDLLRKVDDRLRQARDEIGKATNRSNTIQRRLKGVTELSEPESDLLLGEGDLDEEAGEVLEVEDVYGG
jgi:DNA recombination protein RmuC